MSRCSGPPCRSTMPPQLTDAKPVARTVTLDHREAVARAPGFTAAELTATWPGQRLYQMQGTSPLHPSSTPGDGRTIELVPPMRKPVHLLPAAPLSARGCSPERSGVQDRREDRDDASSVTTAKAAVRLRAVAILGMMHAFIMVGVHSQG